MEISDDWLGLDYGGEGISWNQRAKKRVVSIMKPYSVSPRLAEGVPEDVTNTGVLWWGMLSWDTEWLPL